MPGVYGDHAKKGGWNDIILYELSAQRLAAGEYTPASNELAFVEDWLYWGEIDRANTHIQNGGLLAAAELRLKGVDIKGWESDEAMENYKSYYDTKVIDYMGQIAAREARQEGIEIKGWQSETKKVA
jgi:hypothetical protein